MDEAIDIVMPDVVLVLTDLGESRRHGISVGTWYVWPPDISPPCGSPEERWTVGHADTGYAVADALTFWDAMRVARALDDALPGFAVSDVQFETKFLIDAVIGSALSDHYVFPTDRYLEAA